MPDIYLYNRFSCVQGPHSERHPLSCQCSIQAIETVCSHKGDDALQQSFLSEIPEIAIRRLLDHLHGKFEQTDFPSLVHTMDYNA